MPGPAPTPKSILDLRGSWRAKQAGNTPQPRRGRPKCPSWLDAVAKSKWKQLVPELDALGLLTVVDGDMLAAYCQAFAEFKEATGQLRREGRTCTAGTGGLKAHPAVSMQRSAWEAMVKF